MTELERREEATEQEGDAHLLQPEPVSATAAVVEPTTEETPPAAQEPVPTTENPMADDGVHANGKTNADVPTPEPLAQEPRPDANTDAAATDQDAQPDDGTEATPEAEAETETPGAAGASYTPPTKEADAPPRRLKDLEEGMELEGRVTSIALYGIFVDIGVGRDGLVHISEMSDTRIESPSDLVQIGDSVNVRVKSIDVEARRISLSMRSPQRERPQPKDRPARAAKRVEINHDALSNLKIGDTVEGTITGMAPFGVFVDIGVGKDGLVHISELSDTRVEKPEDAVQINETYTFKLLDIDSEGNRISLSLRRAQRLQKMQQLEAGEILEGRVSGLAPFGAFVDIGIGRDGLVHISQLSSNRVEKVEDVVKVGDTVSVRVLEVDPQSKRISLTMRLEDPPEEPEPMVETSPSSPEPETPSKYDIALQREEARRDGKKRGGRGQRNAPTQQPVVETYTSSDDDDDETFEGNATLEDLLSKFGSNKPNRKNRRTTARATPAEEEDEEDEEEDEEQRYQQRQRQRDAIRRTLKISDDE